VTPSYVARYAPEQLRVLSVTPGITDIASIRYRHEEKLLEGSNDPDELYRRLVLPHKLALNLEYIDRMSLAFDLRLILETQRSIAL
jgi:lipopolysaccharide/colanic/teichoic acid biosynthesis glycosyltransferase